MIQEISLRSTAYISTWHYNAKVNKHVNNLNKIRPGNLIIAFSTFSVARKLKLWVSAT